MPAISQDLCHDLKCDQSDRLSSQRFSPSFQGCPHTIGLPLVCLLCSIASQWPDIGEFVRCASVSAARQTGPKLRQRWAALFSLPLFSRTTTSVARRRPRFPPRRGHLSWARRVWLSAATRLPPLKEVRRERFLLFLRSGLQVGRVVYGFIVEHR